MKRRYLALLVIPLLIMLTGCPFLNKLPLWTLIPNIIRNIGQVVNINLSTYCSDPDGDPLVFTVVSGPGTISGNTYSWTVSGSIGVVTITISASDGKGQSSTSFTITVKGAPNTPSNPSPANNATNQNYPNLTLSWTGGDPDGDSVTYDLYFGTASNPPLYTSNLTSTTYNKAGLLSNTTYYWKIVAKDGVNTKTGPIWAFSTKPYTIVNDSFESRPLGNLSAATLPWATYTKIDPGYSYISVNLGYGGSKGLTFVDSNEAGNSRISRNISALKKGTVQFYLRAAANGSIGFRDNTGWVPYVCLGDMGSGYGMYSWNESTGVFTKIMNVTSNTWYDIYIYFDLNAGQNYYRVYVNDVLRRTEYLTGTFSMTSFSFLTFTNEVCSWADIDNVVITALQPGYSTAGEAGFEEFFGSTDLSTR